MTLVWKWNLSWSCTLKGILPWCFLVVQLLRFISISLLSGSLISLFCHRFFFALYFLTPSKISTHCLTVPRVSSHPSWSIELVVRGPWMSPPTHMNPVVWDYRRGDLSCLNFRSILAGVRRWKIHPARVTMSKPKKLWENPTGAHLCHLFN